MARRTKVVTWYATLCLPCRQTERLQLFTNDTDRYEWIRGHRIHHPAHRPVPFAYAGYGGEAFAATDAIHNLVQALTDTEQLSVKDHM